MAVRKLREYRLKRPPTDICAVFENLYVSTKGKRIFFLSDKQKELKSILFSSQVSSMAASDAVLYCGCSDGKMFGLSSAHKVVFRSVSDVSGVTRCAYDRTRADILVSTNNKKVQSFGENSITKDTFYCYDTPVVDFDITMEGYLACASQNSQSVKVINIASKESRTLQLAGGFSEAVKFLSNELVLVGTLSGALQIYRLKTLEMVHSIKTSGGVHSLYLHKNEFLLVGLADSTVDVYKINNRRIDFSEKISVSGIPVAFCAFRNNIAIAVSREPRLGRWEACKTGKNRIIILKIE